VDISSVHGVLKTNITGQWPSHLAWLRQHTQLWWSIILEEMEPCSRFDTIQSLVPECFYDCQGRCICSQSYMYMSVTTRAGYTWILGCHGLGKNKPLDVLYCIPLWLYRKPMRDKWLNPVMHLYIRRLYRNNAKLVIHELYAALIISRNINQLTICWGWPFGLCVSWVLSQT